jgi:1-acyl-sn-glycerol-3-phosphate acyltransferase
MLREISYLPSMDFRPMPPIRSLFIWSKTIFLIIIWLPFLCVVRLFDRTPARVHTGYWFRALGRAMTRANSFWTIDLIGPVVLPEQRAYVVVSNHQSLADIPIISSVKWEMKWVAKRELFRVPFVGWMMQLAGDIPLDRADRRSGAMMLLRAKEYLAKGCSVMFFPEGTRSLDGNLGHFTTGAFQLAIKTGTPLLPIVLDGSHACLPKKSWVFGGKSVIRLRVFPPLPTEGLSGDDAESLKNSVRALMEQQIREWRAPGRTRTV